MVDADGADRDRVLHLLLVVAVVIGTTALVGVVYLVSQLLGIAAALGANWLGASEILRFTAMLIAIEIVGFGGLSALIVAIANAFDRSLVRVRMPTLFDLALVAGGTGGSLAVVVAIGLVSTLLGVEPSNHSITTIGEQTPAIFLVGAILSVPVIGAMEELFFRGVVQDLLGQVTHRVTAVIVAAALFAAPHLFSYLPQAGGSSSGALAGASISLGGLFFVGIVLGTIYELSDNVVVPALVHGAYNALQFVLTFVAVSVGSGLGLV